MPVPTPVTSRTFSTHREKGKFFDDAMRNPG
jgi:hypothetical protein